MEKVFGACQFFALRADQSQTHCNWGKLLASTRCVLRDDLSHYKIQAGRKKMNTYTHTLLLLPSVYTYLSMRLPFKKKRGCMCVRARVHACARVCIRPFTCTHVEVSGQLSIFVGIGKFRSLAADSS